MKKVSLNALSTAVMNDRIYVLVRQSGKLSLLILNKDLRVVDEIWSTKGQRGFILKVKKDKALVSIDDKLYLVEDDKAETVLTTNVSGNTFWHLVEVDGKLFMIHEYGRPPTSIYVSNDLRSWEKVITNLDIDKRSKHFHDVAYDPYRKWLITTLGDGCVTRVAISEDLGYSWRPLYEGPWQFVPILVLENKLVFGMDSGIARGGVGIFDPKEERWSIIFLKWISKSVKHCQMCDLIQLDNSVWVSALGTPQAIIASRNLRQWYPLYIEDFRVSFNSYMSVREYKSIIVCCTGRSLVFIEKAEIEDKLRGEIVVVPYKGFLDRIKGIAFIVKRTLSP